MNSDGGPPMMNEVREELLARRALEGLDDVERAELARLGGEVVGLGEGYEDVVAMLDVALAKDGVGFEGMPAALAKRIEGEAGRYLTNRAEMDVRANLGSRLLTWGGWGAALAAAAALVLVMRRPPERIVVKVPVPVGIVATPAVEREATAEERFEALGESAASRELAATEHPLAEGARGEVVWSGAKQEGFLRIEGLAKVDPKQGVYQLWIFDKKRDARYPVDGGVFTVEEGGATVIPIRAGLPVEEPTMFAITLEPPGGVVVSDRKRLLLAANWGE